MLSEDNLLLLFLNNDKNTALLNLRSTNLVIRFLSKELIVNQNTFKLIKI
jgi:hypothetical protein